MYDCDEIDILYVLEPPRCAGVALNNLGCQTKGTTVVLPSIKSTLIVSSVKDTFLTLSSV
jgi:hypothetical protein